MDNLGTRIKILRKKLNLTQQELSSSILNRASLSKIENGKLQPTLNQLKYLANMLKVDVSYFLKDGEELTVKEINKENNNYLDKLFNEKKYLDIIEEIKPDSFITYYYAGMSYFRIDLIKEAKKNLNSCQNMFFSLPESKKYLNVEKFACVLNCLRKIDTKNIMDPKNKIYLDKCIRYLKLYNRCQSEIFFMINNNIAAYYVANNKYEETISFIEEFLRENKNVNSPTTLPYVHLNYSIANYAVKNYPKAIEEIQKAIFFFNYIGDIYQEGECYINLFNYFLCNKEFDKCSTLINFLKIRFDDVMLLERYKILEIVLQYNRGEYEEILNKIKVINVEMLNTDSRMDYFFIMGRTSIHFKKYNTAKNYYKRCIKYLERNEKYLDLYIAYEDLYCITKNENDLRKSLEYKKQWKNLKYNSIYPNLTIN